MTMVQDTLTLFGPDWPRREHFAYYRQKVICGYSVTALLEVSGLYHWCRQKQQKFFSAVTYCAARAIASLSEFCMGLDEMGRPGYYPRMHPSYTVFHPEDHTFSDTWTAFEEPFDRFADAMARDICQAKEKRGVKVKPGQPKNFFCISCVPWLSFTGYGVESQGEFNLFPILTVGKCEWQGEKCKMPVSLTISHAAADGYHTSLFYHRLQEQIDALSSKE